MADMNDIVAAGVEAFEKAEVKCRQAQNRTLELIPIFQSANAEAMMGSLEMYEMIAKAKFAAGMMAQAEFLIWGLHRQATTIAQNNSVDIVTPAGGGPR